MSLDIPAHAQERLKGLRSSAHSTRSPRFSVNEFLLVRKAGFEPIGLCVGSASITSAFSTGAGARIRSSRCSRRRCITPASSP